MPKVTQAHRDARRRAILQAARSVFAERGFAQTSTNDIVAASGLSTGAVYSYFPSKHALVAAVCDAAMEDVFGDSPPSGLSDLLSRVPARSSEHARLMAQVWGEAAVTGPLADTVRAQLAARRVQVAALIRDERVRHGLAEDGASEAADAVLALLTGYSLRLAVGETPDEAAFARALRAIAGTPIGP